MTWGQAMLHHYAHNVLPKLKQQQSTLDNRIPTTIHFIWLGPMDAMPLKTVPSDTWNGPMQSWRVHNHAMFEFRLWRDAEGISNFFNREAFQHAMTNELYGMASDILRLEILYEYGGVYIDIDYQCASPIPPALLQFDMVCGASHTGCIEVNNGWMACRPQCRLMRIMMEKIQSWFQGYWLNSQPIALMMSFLPNNDQENLRAVAKLTPTDILRNTGPGLLTQTIGEALITGTQQQEAEDLAILPYTTFHPVPNWERHSLTEQVIQGYLLPGATIGVHLWQSSWQKDGDFGHE